MSLQLLRNMKISCLRFAALFYHRGNLVYFVWQQSQADVNFSCPRSAMNQWKNVCLFTEIIPTLDSKEKVCIKLQHLQQNTHRKKKKSCKYFKIFTNTTCGDYFSNKKRFFFFYIARDIFITRASTVNKLVSCQKKKKKKGVLGFSS